MNSSSVNRTLKAACAAAAVATSWGASQQAHAAVTVFEGLSGSISPTTHGLTHVYLFFASSSSGYPIPQAFALPNAPAGQTTSFYVDAQLDGYNEYTIMGVYDVDNGLVTISLPSSDSDFALGKSFEEVFWGGYNEQEIANALISGSIGTVFDSVAPSGLARWISVDGMAPAAGDSATLISFSSGANNGSAYVVEAVPEPSGAILLGLGGLVLVFRHRREK